MSPSNQPPTNLGTLYSNTMSTAVGGSSFPTTRWTLILESRNKLEPDGTAALNALCQGYWYPLYAYIRRKGHSHEQASDLTQEFFTQLLSGTFFERANPDKGRFRAFLLTALRYFLNDEYDRSSAAKRGAGIVREPLPFSIDDGERFYSREPHHDETPERIYERRWARAVLDRVVTAMRAEFERHGRLDHFLHLKVYLMGQADVPYAALAQKLEISESALKSGIHRFRKRYRDLLREEVAATVADPNDVDAELKYLLSALRGN